MFVLKRKEIKKKFKNYLGGHVWDFLNKMKFQQYTVPYCRALEVRLRLIWIQNSTQLPRTFCFRLDYLWKANTKYQMSGAHRNYFKNECKPNSYRHALKNLTELRHIWNFGHHFLVSHEENLIAISYLCHNSTFQTNV